MVSGASDQRTVRSGWTLTLYPAAGEAGGVWRSAGQPAGVNLGGSDPERAAEEAARRAKGRVRRYCAANRLNRLCTLTYRGAGCHDPGVLRRDVAEFFKGLRGGLGERELAYLWVPEWHPGGHGLHVHFAVGRYVRHSLIRDMWGRGIVHIKLLGNLPVGSGTLGEARLAARYLSKYVSKSVGERRVAGRHRYEVAQGFQPAKIGFAGSSEDDVLRQAAERMGRPPEYVWHSSASEGRHGPPSVWACWGQ